ncbi:hypothetical protein [Catellatospora tritici]|nr:hypothetical protein [Catellatospora tritici]MBV1854296.1 hypothetical protein [Catellatospora tritici]
MSPSDTPREQAPKTPRWVKVSALIAAVLVAAFLVVHLTGTVPTHGGH